MVCGDLFVGRRYGTILLLFVLFNFLDAMRIKANIASIQDAIPSTRYAGKKERLYIAGVRRNGHKEIRKDWNEAVVNLAGILGTENGFVSVYERSGHGSVGEQLEQLDRSLNAHGVGCPSYISCSLPRPGDKI
jgi:hypothetical protein